MSYNVEVKGHLKDLQIHVGIMGEYTSKTAFVLWSAFIWLLTAPTKWLLWKQ